VWVLLFFAMSYGTLPAQGVTAQEKEAAIISLEAPRVQTILKLAMAAENGRGQSRNLKQAASLYCEAAGYGSLEAQYRLGKMFLAESANPDNIRIAATLFRIAANGGHEGAQSMILETKEQAEQLPDCLADFDSTQPDQNLPKVKLKLIHKLAQHRHH